MASKIFAPIDVNRLYSERVRKGLKQRELAEKVGVTETTMSRYCSAGRTPRYEILERIAKELDTTPEYLLGIDTMRGSDSFTKARAAIMSGASEWTAQQRRELIDLLLDSIK